MNLQPTQCTDRHPFSPGSRATGRICNAGRRRAVRAFTLAEVMVAMLVFTLVAAGAYMMMFRSAELVAVARYRDAARGVLVTYADQFERLETKTPTSTASPRYLFDPTTGPTCFALSDFSKNLICDLDYTFARPSPLPPFLPITIGGDTPIPAQVTREVTFVDPDTGATTPSRISGPAGYLAVATFRITYTVRTRTYTDSLTVLRSVDP